MNNKGLFMEKLIQKRTKLKQRLVESNNEFEQRDLLIEITRINQKIRNKIQNTHTLDSMIEDWVDDLNNRLKEKEIKSRQLKLFKDALEISTKFISDAPLGDPMLDRTIELAGDALEGIKTLRELHQAEQPGTCT